MDAFKAAVEKMMEETRVGSALYHFEDDGEEYTLMRNGVAVAGISHGMVAAIPGLRDMIESAWDDSHEQN